MAGLQGVHPGGRGAVFRTIARLGEGVRQFNCGEQGIRSLCGSLTAIFHRGLDDDGEEGYYSSTEDESEVGEEMARRGLGEAGSVTIADSIWNKCVPSDLLDGYRRHLRQTREGEEGEHLGLHDGGHQGDNQGG